MQRTCDPQNTLQKCGWPCPDFWHAPSYHKRAPACLVDSWFLIKVVATGRTLIRDCILGTSVLWLHVRVTSKSIRMARQANLWTGADLTTVATAYTRRPTSVHNKMGHNAVAIPFSYKDTPLLQSGGRAQHSTKIPACAGVPPKLLPPSWPAAVPVVAA